MHPRRLALLAGLALSVLPAASAAHDPAASTDGAGAACAMPASPVPQATADCGATPGIPSAVIDVSGEVYRIELTTPESLGGAYALARGASAASIPNGRVVYADAGPNGPWSWHIDPATLTWAEVTTEVCDGRPTQLQDGVFTFETFCPWSARLLAIDHDPFAPQPDQPGDGASLPLEASGGTSTADRTFARRVELAAGAYTLRVDTGDNLDPTVSGCPAEIRLLHADGHPAPGPDTPFPTLQPVDTTELTWPDLAAGAYDLFLSLGCAWTISFGSATSSAS